MQVGPRQDPAPGQKEPLGLLQRRRKPLDLGGELRGRSWPLRRQPAPRPYQQRQSIPYWDSHALPEAAARFPSPARQSRGDGISFSFEHIEKEISINRTRAEKGYYSKNRDSFRARPAHPESDIKLAASRSDTASRQAGSHRTSGPPVATLPSPTCRLKSQNTG